MLIRKSALEDYDWCPHKFKLVWVDGKKTVSNYKMEAGTRFHEFANWFFDIAGGIDVDCWEELVPSAFNCEEQQMARWFLRTEKSRYEGCKGYFQPAFRELKIVDEERGLSGTIDRADWLDEEHKGIVLVEYKTNRKWNRYTKSSFLRQMAFYSILSNHTICGGLVKRVRYVNPKLQVIEELELTDKHISNCARAILNLQNAIKMGIFPRTCSSFGKYQMCLMCTPEESGAFER